MTRLVAMISIGIFTVAPAVGQRTSSSLPPADRQVIVKFRNGGLGSAVPTDALQANDIAVTRSVGGTGAFLLGSRSHNTAMLIHDLRIRADVLYAEPNFVVKGAATPNTNQWYLNASPGISVANPGAWSFTTGSQGIVVGILDTGADLNHPDLQANLWKAPQQISIQPPWTPVSCAAQTQGMTSWTRPDFSAYQDCSPTFSYSCAAGYSCQPFDSSGHSGFAFHGTQVSGIVGASGVQVGAPSGGPVFGVSPLVTMMQLRVTGNPYVFQANGSPCPGGLCGYISDVLDAIEFAIQSKIAGTNVRILNNSWGFNIDSTNGVPYGCNINNPASDPNNPANNLKSATNCIQALQEEIDRANSNDILFVAIAGNGVNDNGTPNDNDLTPTYPANLSEPNIISVAATGNQSSELAWFSNFGQTTVHLAAPGQSVLTTVPQTMSCNVPTTSILGYGGIDSLSSFGLCYTQGTSYAAPQVSGAAALVLAACPNLDNAGLKGAILSSVDVDPAGCGFNASNDSLCLVSRTRTGGRLNVNKAIQSCQTANQAQQSDIVVQYGNPLYWAAGTLTLGRTASTQQITANGSKNGSGITFQANQIVLVPNVNISAPSSGRVVLSVGPQNH